MTNSNGAYRELAFRAWRAVASVAMVCCIVLNGLSSVSAEVAIPDTRAGRIMSAWLEPFNSDDRTRLDDYFKQYDPEKHADDFMGFRDRVGGFELLSRKANPTGSCSC